MNGDQPEAVVFCARLAAEFRMTFGVDIVLDLVCYRRHGHNETDEPAFTQPIMYRAIKAMPTSRTRYADQLAAEGSVPAADATAMMDAFTATLEDAYKAAQAYKPNKADWLEGHWAGLRQAGGGDESLEDATAVSTDALRQVGRAISSAPAEFDANPKITRQLEAKRTAIDSGEGIDWATGEALAFGTLLTQGNRIRLSGEDCQRGTFSQRHAVLVDQTNQNEYVPLNNIQPEQAKIEIYNSLLSEQGVLGFEYGYTLADPKTLVLWEAQFGDFSNGAQVIIDQFLASGETKWLRMSGLTLLLPHGYEGQGPEHSSARLERYLQLCAEQNMAVCNLTTPANYFHALRRQLMRNFRRPLGHHDAEKPAAAQAGRQPAGRHGRGQRLPFRHPGDRPDRTAGAGEARRAVLGQGVLRPADRTAGEGRDRRRAGPAGTDLPVPAADAGPASWPRTRNAEIVWCQEEPENMGAWTFVDRRIEAVLTSLGNKAARPSYIGRDIAASPATGLAKTHAVQQAALVRRALALA